MIESSGETGDDDEHDPKRQKKTISVDTYNILRVEYEKLNQTMNDLKQQNKQIKT